MSGAPVPRRLVLLLVAAADRRMLPALALTPHLAESEVRAIHVVMDDEEASLLARAWMDLDLASIPLSLIPPIASTLGATVRALVEDEARRRSHVTVIVPELDLGRWWQSLLHRGLGRDVAWHLHGLRNVTSVVVPARVPGFSPRRTSSATRATLA